MATRKNGVVKALKQLIPRDFENLAYDLLFVSGMRNLRWRTPGADGGRDLEGEFVIADFAGDQTTQKWYIECKRYSKSIDWPTVHEKLATAENHRADFLLFITTANFSTPCRDEVDRHNNRGGSAQIRIWPYFYVENLLSVHGQVALKYGLRASPKELAVDFRSIIFEIAKIAQSTYATATFGGDPLARLELLSVFTELLSARATDAMTFGKFVQTRYKPPRDSFEWCTPYPLPENDFDQTSLRAALAAVRTVSGKGTLDCEVISKSRLEIKNVPKLALLRSSQLFALVETFGLLRCEYSGAGLILIARTEDG